MLLIAAQSAVETYGGEGGKVAAQTHESAGVLPFTGIEIVAIVGVAIVLFGLGIVLARLSGST